MQHLPFAALTPVEAQEARHEKIGFTVAGGILTGLGVVNLATSALCTTDLILEDDRDTCLIAALSVGGIMTAVGLPLLIAGVSKHAPPVETKRRRDRRRKRGGGRPLLFAHPTLDGEGFLAGGGLTF